MSPYLHGQGSKSNFRPGTNVGAVASGQFINDPETGEAFELPEGKTIKEALAERRAARSGNAPAPAPAKSSTQRIMAVQKAQSVKPVESAAEREAKNQAWLRQRHPEPKPGYKPKKTVTVSRPVTQQVPVEAPKPQKPAAPAKPVVKGRFTTELLQEARPWTQQPDSDVFWGGMNEAEWDRRSTSLHRWIGSNPNASQMDLEREIDRHFPKLLDGNHEDDIRRFVQNARYNRGEGLSTFQQMGVPHAGTSERGWVSAARKGKRVASLNNQGSSTATDLKIDGGDWDVQNWTNTNGRMGIGVIKYVPKENRVRAQQLVQIATKENWPLDKLTQELKYLGGKSDKLLDEFTAGHPKNKDGLIGTVYEPGKITNRLGAPQKGSFNRSFGQGEFALDLNNLRNETLDQPIRATAGADGQGLMFHMRDGNLKIQMPFEETKAKAGSKGLIRKIVGSDVIESIGEAAHIRGERPSIDYGTRYHGGVPIDGKSVRRTAKDLASSWRGGLGLTVLDGASREVGVRVGQGDYTGAATEFGKTYLTGAALEKGVRATGGILSKKLPGIGARFAAGSAGSGGLLTPVMATIGAVELADGLVEGVTGKDTIAHVNDGIVKPYYQRSTGDNRSEEQIQRNLSGPKRVYNSGIPKNDKPQMTKEAVARASQHLSKVVPEVKPEAPTPTVTPTVKPTVKPKQNSGWGGALQKGISWLRKQVGL